MRYLLYNPFSGNLNDPRENALCYSVVTNMPTEIVSITETANMRDFFSGLNREDDVVIFGGDGTLNRFVNGIDGIEVQNEVYFYPSGTGNDFAKDVQQEDAKVPFLISDYIKNLPTVNVNGENHKFINGVGFGIDGYCCEIGDKIKKTGKKPNYTAIAIKGLLFHFKPVNATVTVDDKESCFKKVWLAPTMHGRYYGGGMMITPEQNRNDKDKTVSLAVFHNASAIKTLLIFPSIFKGTHVKHKKNMSIFKGGKITVRFDRPTSLQIDGETILNVTDYTVEV